MEELKNIWVYVEPFVFISEDQQNVLFYNTNTGDGLTFKKNNIIQKVVAHLLCPENMYSILIDMEDLKEDALFNMVTSLQKKGFGDIVEGDLRKPIILPPILNLQKGVERLKKNDMPVGENILSYLHEITIHVNGDCRQNCNGCQSRFKQFLFCTKNENILAMDQIDRLLSTIVSCAANINITGGNPFQYPYLNELLDALDKKYAIKTLLVHHLNLPKNADILHVFSSRQFRLRLLVCEPYQIDEMVDISERLRGVGINHQWLISIDSEPEYEKADLFYREMAENGIEVDIKPYYDGHNLAFFEEYIFPTCEDIIAGNHSRQDIFALQELNINHFGKLTVMPNGVVYANVNHEPLGTINDSIYDVLCREMEGRSAWRNTRYNMAICGQCIYKLICPSPSNYEIAIGRPNLCHVK